MTVPPVDCLHLPRQVVFSGRRVGHAIALDFRDRADFSMTARLRAIKANAVADTDFVSVFVTDDIKPRNTAFCFQFIALLIPQTPPLVGSDETLLQSGL